MRKNPNTPETSSDVKTPIGDAQDAFLVSSERCAEASKLIWESAEVDDSRGGVVLPRDSVLRHENTADRDVSRRGTLAPTTSTVIERCENELQSREHFLISYQSWSFILLPTDVLVPWLQPR